MYQDWWTTEELVLLALSYLGIKDLQRAELTCTAFYDCAHSWNWLVLYFNLSPILFNKQHEQEYRNSVGNKCENDYMLSKNENHIPTHVKLKRKSRKRHFMLLNSGINPNDIPIPRNPKSTLIFLYHVKKKWSSIPGPNSTNEKKLLKDHEKFLHKNIQLTLPHEIGNMKTKSLNSVKRAHSSCYNLIAMIQGDCHVQIVDMSTLKHIVSPFRAHIQRTSRDEYLYFIQLDFHGPSSAKRKKELGFDQNERMSMYDLHISGLIEYSPNSFTPFLQHLRVYDVDDITDRRIPETGVEVVHHYLPMDECIPLTTKLVSFYADIASGVTVCCCLKPTCLLIFKNSELIGTTSSFENLPPNVITVPLNFDAIPNLYHRVITLMDVTNEAATSIQFHPESTVFEICIRSVRNDWDVTHSIYFQHLRMTMEGDVITSITELTEKQFEQINTLYSISNNNARMIGRDAACTAIMIYDLENNTAREPVPWVVRDLTHHKGVSIQDNMVVFYNDYELQLMLVSMAKKKRTVIRSIPLSIFKLSEDYLVGVFGDKIPETELMKSVILDITASGVILVEIKVCFTQRSGIHTWTSAVFYV
jgi:hypothetical protein